MEDLAASSTNQWWERRGPIGPIGGDFAQAVPSAWNSAHTLLQATLSCPLHPEVFHDFPPPSPAESGTSSVLPGPHPPASQPWWPRMISLFAPPSLTSMNSPRQSLCSSCFHDSPCFLPTNICQVGNNNNSLCTEDFTTPLLSIIHLI